MNRLEYDRLLLAADAERTERIGPLPTDRVSERTFTIRTERHPEKGWRFTVLYQGEAVARGRHHMPAELLSLRQAFAAVYQVLVVIMAKECDPEEVIRADKWEEDARRRSAVLSQTAPKWKKVPVELECGHIRVVKPKSRVGGDDRVNCGPCGTHRSIARFLEQPPALGASLDP